jgi:predicted dehydrogenase/threonine dehydrogenase-like Zn-dependent dehydrogenase
LKQVLIRRGTPIVADVPAPQVTDNNILVQVHFSLISTGTELASLTSSNKSLLRQIAEDPKKIVRGLQMIKESGVRRTMALVNGELEGAFPTGYSCSGEVIACGRGIRNFSVGDRVACAGAGNANHAEIVSIPEHLAVRVPEGCDLRAAASATIGSIAMQGVRRADVRLGELVAVMGLGLIGQITVQLLKAAGCRIIGTDIDSGRIQTAASVGMSQGIDPTREDPVRAALNFSEGRGVDAVIITASSHSSSIVQQAMQMVRRKGRVVVVGAVPLQMERAPFYEKEADFLISCSYGPGRYDPEYEERGLDYPYAYVRWTENRNMTEYLRLLADGQIDIAGFIEQSWPLEEAETAYRELRRNGRVATLLHTSRRPVDLSASVSTETKDSVEIPKQKRIRVGLVGPGSFARAVHLPNLKQLGDVFSIAAVCARNGPNAWNIAKQYEASYASTNIDDLLQDPNLDLILISSRHHLHASQAIAAARLGKSVLLEKPAALNPVELRQLIDAFKNTNATLMVGFNRRFSPLIGEVKEVLDRKAGPVVLSYRMNAGHIPADSWIQGPEGGGRIIGECCHIFDLFNYLIGHGPEEVTALPLRPGTGHVLAGDNFSSVLKYSDGSICTLTYTSLGSSELHKEHMEVFFDGKAMVLDDYRKLTFHGVGKQNLSKLQQEKGHLEELRALAAYLRGDGPIPMTLDEIESATTISFTVDELARQS